MFGSLILKHTHTHTQNHTCKWLIKEKIFNMSRIMPRHHNYLRFVFYLLILLIVQICNAK